MTLLSPHLRKGADARPCTDLRRRNRDSPHVFTSLDVRAEE
uniref:Uncharacterized protein n=1 Tax=Siphoviridae sp. ctwHj1 TaxID=2825727 RepID=A0A8S5U683_9CAUD|nr:MAG TPA: hypothetical protein [Siphoviridae sp. ctwHj1]